MDSQKEQVGKQDVNLVQVIVDGYTEYTNNANSIKSNCTSTIIKGKNGYNILVDTLLPYSKDSLLKALENVGLKPDDINTVVCTHGHSDHCGNNNLFLNADWLFVGASVCREDNYVDHDFKAAPFSLTEDICVVHSPGHTLECVSVLVKNSNLGRVAVVGDIFENEYDIDDPSIWVNAGSQNPDLQRKNRLILAKSADWIIPGHGRPFRITPAMVEKLSAQMKVTQ